MNRLLLGAFAATLLGCAGGDEIATDGGNADLTSSFVGTWTGDSEMTDVQSGNPRFGRPMTRSFAGPAQTKSPLQGSVLAEGPNQRP